MKRAEFERVWAGPVPADKLCPPQQAEVDAAAHAAPLSAPRAASRSRCSTAASSDLGEGGSAASSEYLPQTDHSLVFSSRKKKKKEY